MSQSQKQFRESQKPSSYIKKSLLGLDMGLFTIKCKTAKQRFCCLLAQQNGKKTTKSCQCDKKVSVDIKNLEIFVKKYKVT